MALLNFELHDQPEIWPSAKEWDEYRFNWYELTEGCYWFETLHARLLEYSSIVN